MDIGKLKDTVKKFATVWFPDDGSHVKFWFRARDRKFTQVITQLCEECLSGVEGVTRSSPKSVFESLTAHDWSIQDMLTLAVMLDQMPRNALAVNFGRYVNMDPRDVSSAINESFSIAFSGLVLEQCDFPPSIEERIVCFFSLIFRHANDFDNARKVLNFLRSSSGELPPMAAKFWVETDKREESR